MVLRHTPFILSRSFSIIVNSQPEAPPLILNKSVFLLPVLLAD